MVRPDKIPRLLKLVRVRPAGDEGCGEQRRWCNDHGLLLPRSAFNVSALKTGKYVCSSCEKERNNKNYRERPLSYLCAESRRRLKLQRLKVEDYTTVLELHSNRCVVTGARGLPGGVPLILTKISPAGGTGLDNLCPVIRRVASRCSGCLPEEHRARLLAPTTSTPSPPTTRPSASHGGGGGSPRGGALGGPQGPCPTPEPAGDAFPITGPLRPFTTEVHAEAQTKSPVPIKDHTTLTPMLFKKGSPEWRTAVHASLHRAYCKKLGS